MTRVERIAKAIYESHGFVKPWDHADTRRIWHDSMMSSARAALRELGKIKFARPQNKP